MSFEAKSQNELLAELRRLEGVVQDQETLRRELERYKDLFCFAADAILMGDHDGNIIEANHSAALLTGYAHEELLGMNISRLFAADVQVRTPLRYDLLKVGQVVHNERVLTRKDGTTAHISMNSKMMSDGSYHTFIRDISERIQAEKALKDREAALSSILRAAPIGIGVTHNRRIGWASETLLKMLGYSADEVVGRNARILYLDDQEYARVGEKKYRDIAEQKIGVVETRWKRKDGQILDILLSSTPVTPCDISQGVTFTALDITERKATEEKQREIAQMKSEFIATASHELRTPLAVALGYLELLLNDGNFSPLEQREFLAIILEKAQVLERLVDELLDVSRIESGRMIRLEREPVRIAETVDMVIRQFHKESSKHHFSCEVRDKDIELFIDREKIVQVLENLVGNAVKFSPLGGRIVVQGEVAGDCYRLSVRDEGIGMTAHQKEKIFEKFYRVDNSNTAVRGLGIGLFLTKNIIEAHRGEIWVESRLGEGATFFFTLPLGAPPQDDTETHRHRQGGTTRLDNPIS